MGLGNDMKPLRSRDLKSFTTKTQRTQGENFIAIFNLWVLCESFTVSAFKKTLNAEDAEKRYAEIAKGIGCYRDAFQLPS
jgi:hypothetical protein